MAWDVCHSSMEDANPLEKENFNRALKPGSQAELSRFCNQFYPWQKGA